MAFKDGDPAYLKKPVTIPKGTPVNVGDADSINGPGRRRISINDIVKSSDLETPAQHLARLRKARLPKAHVPKARASR